MTKCQIRATRARVATIAKQIVALDAALKALNPLMTDGEVNFALYRDIAAPMHKQVADLLKAQDKHYFALYKASQG
jgi:hypothetical protein